MNFGPVSCSNPEDNDGRNCNFCDDTALTVAYLGGRALGDPQNVFSKAPNRVVAVYTLILFSARNLLCQTFFNQNVFVYSCIFACDAVNLMVSCSLLVFMQKIILLLRKFTKIVANRAAPFNFGSDINEIVRSAAGTSPQTPLAKLIALGSQTS